MRDRGPRREVVAAEENRADDEDKTGNDIGDRFICPVWQFPLDGASEKSKRRARALRVVRQKRGREFQDFASFFLKTSA